eukprot:SAG22_NODE_4639_length_1208_cov_1.192967_1_plen_25_part_10
MQSSFVSQSFLNDYLVIYGDKLYFL